MGVIALILLPILIFNIILIVKGSTSDEIPPDIGGIAPLTVDSGSMDGDEDDSFPQGSLLLVRLITDEEKQQLETGTVITYYIEEDKDSYIYVSHRIIVVNRNENDEIVSFITQGDAKENDPDPSPVPVANVVGVYQSHIPVVGYIVTALRDPLVIGLVIGIPVIAFITYDVVRITLYNRKVKEQELSEKALADKDEEIARLRALVGEQAVARSAEPAPASENSEVSEEKNRED